MNKSLLYGEVGEWFNPAILKIAEGDEPSIRSNRIFSAIKNNLDWRYSLCDINCFDKELIHDEQQTQVFQKPSSQS